MKEITRVHIAKTSYDIEVVAKKELEKYIGKLTYNGAEKPAETIVNDCGNIVVGNEEAY